MLYSALELLQFTGVFLNKRLLLLTAKMEQPTGKPRMPVPGLLGTAVALHSCFAHILIAGMWTGVAGPELAGAVLYGN